MKLTTYFVILEMTLEFFEFIVNIVTKYIKIM
jgi:hypothetical protein